MRQEELYQEIMAAAEQSYNQLEGEYRDWLEVARWYEHKVPSQDRYDLRHDIMLRLAKLASKNGHDTLSQAAMCRVASYVVADYWRAYYKLTSGLDCGHCSTKQRRKCRSEWLYSECPKLIKLEYLSKPITDSEGNITELGELIADDHAIDLDAWLDAKTFKLGCPKRLIAIAEKLDCGESLDGKDRKYLCKWRKKEQPKLF